MARRVLRQVAEPDPADETRNRLLDAAEAMFSELGWQGTTLREVAARAGSSIGAMFQRFADKGELFQAVIERDTAALVAKMAAAAETDAPVEEAILAIFMTGYAHYDAKLPFLRALQQVMWSEDGHGIRMVLAAAPLPDLLISRLKIAALWGELRDERLGVRGRMLADSYLANYPHALYGAWDLQLLEKRSQAQISVILAGARPPPGKGR